ncbi:MAG: long-chain fatty acid--CoA ligase [Caldilineaceae bacterium]|nr:long-chain fatty acid--CoA ligase [Caldilineaceae bacterium]MDE0071808.1 long-chain fatty acid--CoA ligase [Caldilineaceae bacterium]
MSSYDQKPWVEKYESGVPEAIEYNGQLTHEMLDASAQTYANQVSTRLLLSYLPLGITVQATQTYAALKDSVDRLAFAFRKIGLQQGDRVAIMLPNIPQQVISFFATLRAGCVVVNTNPTYTPRELGHLLEDSGATAIIVLSGFYDRVAQVKDGTDLKHVIVTDLPEPLGFPFNKLVEKKVRKAGMMVDVPDGPGVWRFDDLISTSEPDPPAIDVSPDDVVLFQYTGGTTGSPKAAMLTHRNVMSNVQQIEAWYRDLQYGGEKVLGAIPFFHVYGMSVAMLFSIYTGAELIVTPDPRQTDLVLEILQREKVTMYPGIPTMYTAIINHPKVDDADLSSIRACLSGGMSLPGEIQRRFEQITGGKLVEGYGLTETSPVACANPINGMRKEGSIGFPVPSTEVAIVGLERNDEGEFEPVPAGEEGELIIRGPQVMKGYWKRPEETAEAISEEGWFHTGDIARMDEDGCFYIVDRKKDLIIASGYNIVPREVEEVLYTHEKVQEAVVVGVPDEVRGENVKAYIVLKAGQSSTPEEITEFCREQLAPYKVPRLVDFRDELPKSQVGKILRRVLLEEEKQKQA